MQFLFSGCSSLSYLPDISKWNLTDVKNINAMFSECSSLISLPDISNWFNFNRDIDYIPKLNNQCKFGELFLLFKTERDYEYIGKNISYLFYKCLKLKYLPDISKWNTIDVVNMKGLFSDCSNLINLPDISKWKIKNEIKIERIFYECHSLISLPDISKWNNAKDSDIASNFCDDFNDSNNSNILNGSIKILIKSSFSNNSNSSDKINSLEQFEDFVKRIESEEENNLIEHYENFYN